MDDSIKSEADDDTILLDTAVILAKHKRVILGLPFVVAIIAAGISLLMPDIYTATTAILPPQHSQSAASSLLAQIGVSIGAGSATSNGVYIAMMKSRTVRDRLIERGLIDNPKHPSPKRTGPPEVATFSAAKDGIITVKVDGPDPKRAADLANGYVDELVKFTRVLAVTEASQRRLFFEKQFDQAKEKLAKIEVTARQALEKGGVVNVDDQGRAMIQATARLRAEITVKQVQIGVMRTFAAEGNPDLRRAQQELESMKHELAKIEGSGVVKAVESQSGSKGIANLEILRNLQYYETIYALLAKQYQLAKIDEAKDPTIIQVMDKAIPPEHPSKPRRVLIVVIWTVLALFAAVLWAHFDEVMTKARADPRRAEKLQALRRYLGWR